MLDKENMADLLIEKLNEIAEHDPVAIGQLIEVRIACNAKLADHPTVQVSDQGSHHEVGILGILNGLIGTIDDGPKKGWGLITAVFENDGSFAHFRRTKE